MVRQKEAQDLKLLELEEKRRKEKQKREAEIQRLMEEQWKKKQKAFEEDIGKYVEIANSKFGTDLKDLAWKSLIDRYPEGKGIKTGDIDGLKLTCKGVGRLFVRTEPANADVRVLNIKPRFRQGMELKPGQYKVAVSAEGYETKQREIFLTKGKDKIQRVHLKKDKAVIERDGQFVAHANGIVKDTNTGLEWKVGADEDMNWNEARSWVQSLNLDGGGWRMPTMNELAGLYKKGAGDRNMTPLLKTTGWHVWSSETKGSSYAWYFYFSTGRKSWLDRSSGSSRAFAVRSRGEVTTLPQKPKNSLPSSTSKELKHDGQYIAYANGIVKDTRTGLEWKVGPDRNTTWNETRAWVKSLNLDGGGWRMPTLDELEGLYKKGAGDRNRTSLLKATGWNVWSGETKGSSEAMLFYFGNGRRQWRDRDNAFHNWAFAVRSKKLKKSRDLSEKPKESSTLSKILDFFETTNIEENSLPHETP